MAMREVTFGYRLPQTEIIIEECEATLIRQSAADYLNGMSMTELAVKLNKQPIRYREDKRDWDKHQTLALLRNKLYMGNEYYPQIIDEITFNDIQKLIYSRCHRMTPEEKKYADVFKSKMICTECGSTIKRRAGTKGCRELVKMRCPNKSCTTHAILSPQVDVEKAIKKVILAIAQEEINIENDMKELGKTDKNPEINVKASELRLMMQNPTIDAETIVEQIRELASMRFDDCDATDNTALTEKIKDVVKSCSSQERIEADVIDKVIKKMMLESGKELTIVLANGIEIKERMG